MVDDERATSATLDAVAATHPVFLLSWSGHVALLNSKALRRLQISESEADPAGGVFSRGENGSQLSGLAYEYACTRLVQGLFAETPIAGHARWLAEFATSAVEHRVTTVQLMPDLQPRVVRELVANPALAVRIRIIDMPLNVTQWTPDRVTRPASETVSFSGLKIILDGAPIERWSRLRQPYADRPTTSGHLNFTPHALQDILRRAMAAGEPPMIHASGDAAVDAALDALEATGGTRWAPLRPRIEHADGFGVEHVERARRMGIIVVQNPSHFSLATGWKERLGASRVQHYQQVRMILEAGIPLAFGSDGPFNPFLNIMFATTNPTNPSQAVDGPSGPPGVHVRLGGGRTTRA
ncbi:N-substituted formamide deformylase precursor [Luteitalea pratensis]|uniref:N-substituted formamide deformylase n=1 Tax=Luteitalea pratensis TaxID=1855912 RepID=A0A143PLR5_LUTPR|nr:N-substituted formamide deformylase precursor [Luteitalea pratensis]